MGEDEVSPPVPAAGAAGSPVKLYTVGQIFLGAILGSPIGGAHLMARNEVALGNDRAARRAVFLGIAATLALFVLGSVLPDRWDARILPFVAAIAVRQIAQQREGLAIASHLNQGGARQSWWSVVGIGVLYLLALLGAAVLYWFVVPE